MTRMVLAPTQANIMLQPIMETNGYIELYNNKFSIPIESDLVLHYIVVKETTSSLLLMRNYLNTLKPN